LGLDNEILERSKEISTDSYPMSVGELVSLYRDGELDVHPEFQRFFRWNPEQKSAFIESILLGIPTPSIFISTKINNSWEVIDGLQRLSTILHLMGELNDQNGNRKEPLTLLPTKYLPSLGGKRWSTDPPGGPDELPPSAKLKIKRSKLDLKIVLNTSDPAAKYELFQRLNRGGSFATDQEVRNCILIMVQPSFFDWISGLANDENFKSCILLSDRSYNERYDLELIVRFLVFRTLPEGKLTRVGDLGIFLTDAIVTLAESENFDRPAEEEAFKRTFSLLSELLGEDSFKKYDPQKRRSLGSFLISVYEVMALGIGYHCLRPDFAISSDRLKSIHESLWTNGVFTGSTGSGVRASSRIPVTIPLGRALFRP
jgi:hypothetical protein